MLDLWQFERYGVTAMLTTLPSNITWSAKLPQGSLALSSSRSNKHISLDLSLVTIRELHVCVQGGLEISCPLRIVS